MAHPGQPHAEHKVWGGLQSQQPRLQDSRTLNGGEEAKLTRTPVEPITIESRSEQRLFIMNLVRVLSKVQPR